MASPLIVHSSDTSDRASSIATSQKEVPIQSISIFEVCHQVFVAINQDILIVDDTILYDQD